MKIAITGKGGVGKTTFTSILSSIYASEGYRVLAVDADPDANLALALGFNEEQIDSIVPISEMKKLIADRTNADGQSFGKMFKINPKVDDIPDKFCLEKNGVKLLTMGTVNKAGSGCFCPENVLLKKLTSHLILQNKDVVIMDMEAGIEHIGRGTAQGVDAFIVVIEPGIRSIQTYKYISSIAKDLGVKKVFAVANKIRNKEDEEYIKQNIKEEDLLGFMHYSWSVIDSDRVNKSPYEVDKNAVMEVEYINKNLRRVINGL